MITLKSIWGTIGKDPYNRFRDHHTTTAISSSEVASIEAKELLAKIPKVQLVKYSVLEKIRGKISSNEQLNLKIQFWIFVSMLLVLSNVIGVNLEFGLFGFKLQDVNKLKELVLVAVIASNTYSSFLFMHMDKLRELEKVVAIKVYGRNVANVYLDVVGGTDRALEIVKPPQTRKFRITLRGMLFRLVPFVFEVLVVVILLAVTTLGLAALLAVDIWYHSNLPSPLNYLLVLAFVFTLTSQMVHLLVRLRKTPFTNAEKEAEFEKLLKNEKQRKEAMRVFFTEELHARNRK